MSRWQHTGAFVVQFQPEIDLETGQCKGRIEHVATSYGRRFDSLEELLGFIEHTLAQAEADSDLAVSSREKSPHY